MKVEYIIVHHTGAEENDAEQVRRYHLSLGWRDVGYNYIIERDGRVVAGRSLAIPGAHCRDAGMNFKSAGVALIGNLMDHPPTSEQWQALIELVRDLCRRYGVPPERVLGHNEVPGAATDCPGRFMDMELVREEAAAAPNGAGETAAPNGPVDAAAGAGAGNNDIGPGEEEGGARMESGEAAGKDASVPAGTGDIITWGRSGPDKETAPAAGPASLWRVQVGAFAKKKNAEALANKLRSEGYDVYIVKPTG